MILLLLGKELVMPTILPHINAGSDVQALSFTLNALILIGVGLLLGAAARASRSPLPQGLNLAGRRGSSRRRSTTPTSETGEGPVVVEVARRGKLVVGEPFFTPGLPLTLDRHGLGDAGPGDLVVVRKGRGRARLERVLGPAGSIEPVLEGLLVENGLPRGFEPYEPPEPSLEGRVDLRDLLSFTIDPETAKDFDDAISVRREGDGIRVWVHIADVSWFVPAGSPLDHGAAGRALSTYVPGTVAPMLPHEIADDLCSLRPGQDRLTVTVEVGARAARRTSTGR